MKKLFLSALVLTLSLGAIAQDQVGVYLGGFNGLSYKHFLSKNLALQCDLGVGLQETVGNTVWYAYGTALGQKIQEHHASETVTDLCYYDFSLNPNLLYQADLGHRFAIYGGAGVSLGLADGLKDHGHSTDDLMGKWGVNGIVGAEYKFGKAPLAVAIDFRPGYGMLFNNDVYSHSQYNNIADVRSGGYANIFDWKLGLAIRYCL